MEHKPITRKQMRWQITLQVVSIVLMGAGLVFGRTIVDKILFGLGFSVSVYSIIDFVLRWKKHPLVDEEGDREFVEEKKSALISGIVAAIISMAVIIFIIMAVRACRY
jgi:uncharacterized membrane protein YedE/YeeE